MNTSTRRKFLQSLAAAGAFIPFVNHAAGFAASNDEYKKTVGFEGDQQESYLADLKAELVKEWPNNRTINLVFHGHSVPSGYFKTPVVDTAGAYPHQLLTKLKTLYPYAVINCITTSIGGENSQQGAKRFVDVLNHRPDVVFIDYALNDRGIGLAAARKAWSQMIRQALKKKLKVILLTPSPDLKENILSTSAELQKHSTQLEELAKEMNVGLSDSYLAFRDLASKGNDLSQYMSQFNHPNQQGHQVIADRLFRYFN